MTEPEKFRIKITMHSGDSYSEMQTREQYQSLVSEWKYAIAPNRTGSQYREFRSSTSVALIDLRQVAVINAPLEIEQVSTPVESLDFAKALRDTTDDERLLFLRGLTDAQNAAFIQWFTCLPVRMTIPTKALDHLGDLYAEAQQLNRNAALADESGVG